MARCKLTRMNLRNIRKSKEYQALLIDLVAAGIVGKSAAEGLLGYTIPAGLLSADPVTPDDEEEPGTGGETGGEGTSGESGTEIELPVIVYGSGGSFVPVQVGTVKVSADNIGSILTYPFNDSWFTGNKGWSNEYSNPDLYTISQVNFGTDDATIEISESDTAADIFAQLDPETVSLYVEMAASSSSSSS